MLRMNSGQSQLCQRANNTSAGRLQCYTAAHPLCFLQYCTIHRLPFKKGPLTVRFVTNQMRKKHYGGPRWVAVGTGTQPGARAMAPMGSSEQHFGVCVAAAVPEWQQTSWGFNEGTVHCIKRWVGGPASASHSRLIKSLLTESEEDPLPLPSPPQTTTTLQLVRGNYICLRTNLSLRSWIIDESKNLQLAGMNWMT